MLDGLQHVVVPIALAVTVAALLAGILGWLIGRASGRRRTKKAVAASAVSRLTPAPAKTSDSYSPRRGMDVPVPVAEEVLAPAVPASFVDVTEPGAPVTAEVAAPQDIQPPSPIAEPVAEPVVEEADEDPDRTVLRPAPGMTPPSKTPLYAPSRFTVVASTLSESELVAGRTASVQEVQELRRELRAKELELGKLEAGALSAWDRTVPALETQISDLQDENALLRRQIREAEEHSDADAQTVERLRSLVAERDTRLAEIRAQS